jgi:hypothetical protein
MKRLLYDSFVPHSLVGKVAQAGIEYHRHQSEQHCHAEQVQLGICFYGLGALG